MTSLPLLSGTAVALCIFCILLVPLAAAGLSLINAGLGRSRSAAHCMLASLCVISIAAIVYVVWGFSLQGLAGRSAHSIILGGKSWSWVAAEPLFFRGLDLDGTPASLAAWLQILSVGLAALIPLGSGSDRWRFGAACASTVLLAGITYPIFAHWVWGGGWLAQLGTNYGIGHGFMDAGGASSIQVVGGFTALSLTWILGPRRGKYALDGMPAAIPGHNTVVVLFGCFLAWMGWTALNSAGAILFAAADPMRVVLIAINTSLAAASSCLATVVITRIRFGKPDASLSANGWVGGLVGSCAACAFVKPAAAIMIGIIAGALVTFSVEFLDRLSIDDPAGSVSVHAVSGLWSILALGIFGHIPSQVGNASVTTPHTANSGQWLAQVVGIATLLGFVLPLTYVLNLLINYFYPHRVTQEGERQGMDLHELGAGAYPEFVTHGEEFTLR